MEHRDKFRSFCVTVVVVMGDFRQKSIPSLHNYGVLCHDGRSRMVSTTIIFANFAAYGKKSYI